MRFAGKIGCTQLERSGRGRSGSTTSGGDGYIRAMMAGNGRLWENMGREVDVSSSLKLRSRESQFRNTSEI